MLAIKYYFRPLGVNQVQAFTSTAASASNVGLQTYAVMLHASTDCYVNFSGTASATAGAFLKADEPYVFDIHPNGIISVIRKTGDGNLEISELTQ